jgi:hypothetical protein
MENQEEQNPDLIVGYLVQFFDPAWKDVKDFWIRNCISPWKKPEQ